ncbi:MAG: pyruvate dehydrogenase (acetyl-transferring) E1 component subunit alpha [Dehalococcoidia bacterium]|jgi:pyruvate dehydrogenase E1 component alpha subunit|nr:pyruvate dehydrogenase (acetyl-transferring) E1 component subunit alpha [Dehalococcoidia bacterium]
MQVATFAVTHHRFLDPSGRTVQPLPAFANDPETLRELYRAMVLTRTFDTKAIALQRSSRIGTYPSSLGQEAVAVGLAAAMTADDVLLPSFREHGAQLWRGVTPTEMFLYWGGDERGSDFAVPREDFPNSVPIGSQAPHAVGVALAMKLRRQPRAAVCVFGDGATSKGDVAEAMNMAGNWRAPVVFVISNNRWAISVPRAAQTAAATLAQKAIAAGIPGDQVDGNDVIAVRHVVGEALHAARAGGGPRVVEALTYRLSDHTTADSAKRYRDQDAVAEAWKEEPIGRLRAYLTGHGAWSDDDECQLIDESTARIDRAAEQYFAMEPAPPSAVFEYLYAALPKALEGQRDEVVQGHHHG